MWSAKFLSKARKKKYLDILTGEVKVTFEDETNKTTEEKVLEKLNEEDCVNGRQIGVQQGKPSQDQHTQMKMRAHGLEEPAHKIQAQNGSEQSREEVRICTIKIK